MHILLGVHPDDVMADYMLTNTAGNIEQRIEAGAKHMRDRGMDEAAIRTLMSVHPDFLETALKAIIARHGSVDSYAEEVLGVTPQLREKLQQVLVE